jgi:hypothetical protein
MRWISLPYELGLPHLLHIHDMPPALREGIREAAAQLAAGAFSAALEDVRETYVLAKSQQDHYGQSLALLFRAEIYRRMLCWVDCLESIRGALYWLELSASPVGRYNEAMAVYLEGMVHWMLCAEDKLVQTFAYAQQVLVESERYWGYERHEGRVSDCRDVVRWMAHLLEIRKSLAHGEGAVIVPVYEFINNTRIRTGAFAIPPFSTTLPADSVAQCLPANYAPVDLDACFTPSLSPNAQYAAVRIVTEGQWLQEGRVGDLLIVEVMGASSYPGELLLVSERLFLRRTDGRIEFQPALAPVSTWGHPSERGLVGIPRILIRGGEER